MSEVPMLVHLLVLGCTTAPESSLQPGPDSPSVVESADPGNTLFSYDPRGPGAWLMEIDGSGNTVWELDVSTILAGDAQPLGVEPSVADVQLLDDGNILFASPALGIYEIDREGNRRWHLPDVAASHDVDRLPNGHTLYVRTWAHKGEPQVVEVDAEGREVWSWNGMEHYGEDARFAEIQDEGDAWMHPTGVKRMADGTTHLVARNFNAIISIGGAGNVVGEYTFQAPADTVLGRTEGTIPGERPHAVEWYEDGSFIAALRAPSRIVQVQPGASDAPVWEWNSQLLRGIRDVDRLPNGSLLVAAMDRLVELSPDGQLVSSYMADRSGATDVRDGFLPHAFHAASRISPDGRSLDGD